jgi:HEAT repeat protein
LSGQNSLGKLDAIATNEALPIDLRLQAKADLVSWEDDKYTDEVLQALNLDTVLANPVLKNNLAVVVRDHVHDPRHASLLTGLSTSRDDLVRRAAATALSSMSSPGLLPVFARLLSDSDREVRYMAVTGIAKQSGTSAEIPSQMKFFANEPQLIREARESASTNPARR